MRGNRTRSRRSRRRTAALLVGVVLLVASCGGSAEPSPAAKTSPSTPKDALMLGDGKLSTTPEAGTLMSCLQRFAKLNPHNGPWIDGDVWYPSQKIAVEGEVKWTDHSISITVSGNTRTISANNLPDHTTGVFPIQRSDPAYAYDTNPNPIRAQDISLALPAVPAEAAAATCVPMGMIGFATTGVAIFNAVDDSGNDAAAHEVQDRCDGHPNAAGQYHYHGPSSCMPNAMTSDLVGYALDGFGIYGARDAGSGKLLHTADLDECHGTTSPIPWDGQMVSMYHYVLTAEYPYTVGCFRGTPVDAGLTAAQRAQIASFH